MDQYSFDNSVKLNKHMFAVDGKETLEDDDISDGDEELDDSDDDPGWKPNKKAHSLPKVRMLVFNPFFE